MSVAETPFADCGAWPTMSPMEAADTSGSTLSVIEEGAGGRRAVPLLYLVLEYRRPVAGSARYSLDGIDEVRLGRGESRTVAETAIDGARVLEITVPDARLSATHLRLARIGPAWALEDLGSKNGTRLNDAMVTHAPLNAGDRIEVGETMFVYDESSTAPAERHCDSVRDGVDATLLPELAARFTALESVAPTDLSILLRGETGTGKELVANWVHNKRRGAFVPVNCGALPEAIAESELFGYRKGAFSGAREDRTGLVRSASGGTLFLDEVADLRPASQAALLRVLEEQEVMPLGATRPTRVDVRFVSATHQDLDGAVATGRFRADLLARLAGHVFELPPLRARLGELGSIVGRLLPNRHVRFAPSAARALTSHSWPMNIRELRHALASAATLAGDDLVRAEHLPRAMTSTNSDLSDIAPRALTAADEALRAKLVEVLHEQRGNISGAARVMNTDRKQIRRWVTRLGIVVPR